METDSNRIALCQRCGMVMPRTCPNLKYCPLCRLEVAKENDRIRRRKQQNPKPAVRKNPLDENIRQSRERGVSYGKYMMQKYMNESTKPSGAEG